MVDAAASFRQQRANRLLTLCAVGKFADAAFECCAATMNPLILQQVTGAAFAAGGTISWVEPLQITPQVPPRIATGLCVRVCAVFQRYAFGRGQVIFDVGFGPDDRIFEIVADPGGYHLVAVPKQPGSYWCIDQLPDPAQLCKVRIDCHLSPHSKQVLAFPVPPHIENAQTNITFKTVPEGLPVLAVGSTFEKVHFLVADYQAYPTASAELSFQYTRRVLTVKTPQPGVKQPVVHIHDVLAKACLIGDAAVFNINDVNFQQYLNSTGLRRAQQEDEISFARRVQQFMAQTISYVPVTSLGKSGGAAILCQQRELDSAGHAVLFVSILRANSVPARVLVGRWVSSDVQPASHYRTEFFADMVGWVPVEPTEKGDSLYFGSDAKVPFICTSFGEMTSNFRIQSSTQYAYGSNLPPHITLAWREPHFSYVAGTLSAGSPANVEQWSSVIGDPTLTMPNVPGAAHQQPTSQRYAKAHESGPPVVGARARPYANSVATTSTATNRNSNVPTGVFPPPPVPARQHAHSSVQVTTFGQNGGYGQPAFVQSQVPPQHPPHSNGPPALPPHQQQGPPPQLPPHNGGYSQNAQHFPSGGYGPPPTLPPHQQQGPPPQLPPQHGSYGGPPPLPAHQQQGPPQLPPHSGYSGPQYGGPPQLPPQQHHAPSQTGTLPTPGMYGNQQGPPQQQQFNQGPPPQLPAYNGQYGQPSSTQPPPQLPPQQQDYSNQQYSQYGQIAPQPTSSAGATPMGLPSVAQPRPVSIKPQQQLAQLEAAQAQGNAAGGPGNQPGGAPPKSGIKVAVLPPNGAPNGTGPVTAKGGVAKSWQAKAGPAKAPLPTGPGGPTGGPAKLGGAPAKFNGGVAAPAGAKVPMKVTRTFARATFDHVPQDHLELALQKGDIIEILSEDDSGWWKADKLGKIGIVPAPYIEKLGPQSKIAKAVFPFDAVEPTDLQLQVGEFAVVVNMDGDWWEAEAHGNRGSVPNNYVQLI